MLLPAWSIKSGQQNLHGIGCKTHVKVAWSDFWVTIPFNFEWLKHHHYQSNRKSNVSGMREKDESIKWGTLIFTKIWVTIATRWRHAPFYITPNNLPPGIISDIQRQNLRLDIVVSTMAKLLKKSIRVFEKIMSEVSRCQNTTKTKLF